ncbi:MULTISPECIES: LysR substrate-binding domain-containing protein [unclassified Duganella]|uniref:LysR substrate-binding domain-containing protein n=1 Tax=unclassified Duganella TaxID=2636909 RepID=UPI0008885D51|nr:MULTISPECIES: LysR substrate-binding domain-containing protein [unclassified Duganella]SDF76396.1 LysR family transcriptional regulator, transcriptional activator for dmlA [Duganella sp. OV458]SDI52989.1 transcriptional regulator, LysR family [Duganella sp. OV510]
MDKRIDNEDLRVFATAARKASFAAAAEELGMSPAYVSKRIGILEQMLGVRLFHRTTRRVIVSEDGEKVYAHAMTILENLDSLLHEVAERRDVPRGLLRISSSFGFGRNVVAPVVARLVAAHPTLQVRFEVFDRLVDIVSEGFDLDVRIGDEIAPQLIARKLMANHRILCASPAYLQRHGTPRTLQDLAGHNCLAIKERDLPFGVWSLRAGGEEETVKVTGSLSSNHGEIALQWAMAGAGIVLRSHWDAKPHLDNGELVQVLPQYTQSANVWAVYPQRLAGSAKVRVCVEFMEQQLAQR